MRKILVEGFSPSVQKAFDENLEHVLSRSMLIEFMQKQLDMFSERLNAAMSENEFLDSELAKKLYLKSTQLLELARQNPQAEHVPYVLAAVQYFIDEDDGNADFEGIDGFEDDHQVLERVVETFSLGEELNHIAEQKKVS